jgi:hypothetical protein
MRNDDESVADVKTNVPAALRATRYLDRRRSRRRITGDSSLNAEWTHVVTCKLLLRKKMSEISE